MADRPNPTQMQKYLGGIDYPASRQEIIEHAKKNGADEEILNYLQGIPEKDYEKPTDVSSAYSHN